MTDAAVGRLLVASLHQGIADLLPMRLEFYEAWLHPSGLREGRIGLAPLAAVLSFALMFWRGLCNATALVLPHCSRARQRRGPRETGHLLPKPAG